MTDPLLEIADALYGLPQEDFTPARDAKAKELKADKELSAAVKKLKKPSVAAWVVNLFVRREAGQVDQLVAVGEALREAQEGMDGAELRALTRQRRQLTSAVTQQARALAKDEGVKVTTSVGDQVEATLTAAMVDPECARAVRSGLLTAALASTGVDAVDVAAAVAVPDALGFTATPTTGGPADGPAHAAPDLHVVPADPDIEAERKREEAQAALAAAQETVGEVEASLAESTEAVAQLQARSLQLQSEIDEVRRRLSELETSAEETDEELEEAEQTQAEAEAAHSAASKARDAAQKTLDKLT
jgi:DNA repair exonuclease SbcCD ATPase subunit